MGTAVKYITPFPPLPLQLCQKGQTILLRYGNRVLRKAEHKAQNFDFGLFLIKEKPQIQQRQENAVNTSPHQRSGANLTTAPF